MLKPVAVKGAYESRKRQTCVVPAYGLAPYLREGSRKRTSWCRGFGVGEQHHTALALLHKLRKCGLLSVVCLDFSTEASEINCIANLGWSAGGSTSSCGLAVAIGRIGDSFLRSFDCVGHGISDNTGGFGDSFGGTPAVENSPTTEDSSNPPVEAVDTANDLKPDADAQA